MDWRQRDKAEEGRKLRKMDRFDLNIINLQPLTHCTVYLKCFKQSFWSIQC